LGFLIIDFLFFSALKACERYDYSDYYHPKSQKIEM